MRDKALYHKLNKNEAFISQLRIPCARFNYADYIGRVNYAQGDIGGGMVLSSQVVASKPGVLNDIYPSMPAYMLAKADEALSLLDGVNLRFFSDVSTLFNAQKYIDAGFDTAAALQVHDPLNYILISPSEGCPFDVADYILHLPKIDESTGAIVRSTLDARTLTRAGDTDTVFIARIDAPEKPVGFIQTRCYYNHAIVDQQEDEVILDSRAMHIRLMVPMVYLDPSVRSKGLGLMFAYGAGLAMQSAIEGQIVINRANILRHLSVKSTAFGYGSYPNEITNAFSDGVTDLLISTLTRFNIDYHKV